MTARITIKRGDTFAVQGTVSGLGANGLTNWTIKSQVRMGRSLVCNLVVTIINAITGIYQLTYTNTAAWPTTILQADIKYTTDTGQVISTETFEIECKAGVTE